MTTQEPPRKRAVDEVRVSLGYKREAIDISLGFARRGVFVSFVGPAGKRLYTVGMTAARARRLGTTLMQAAEASDKAGDAA